MGLSTLPIAIYRLVGGSPSPVNTHTPGADPGFG